MYHNIYHNISNIITWSIYPPPSGWSCLLSPCGQHLCRRLLKFFNIQHLLFEFYIYKLSVNWILIFSIWHLSFFWKPIFYCRCLSYLLQLKYISRFFFWLKLSVWCSLWPIKNIRLNWTKVPSFLVPSSPRTQLFVEFLSMSLGLCGTVFGPPHVRNVEIWETDCSVVFQHVVVTTFKIEMGNLDIREDVT